MTSIRISPQHEQTPIKPRRKASRTPLNQVNAHNGIWKCADCRDIFCDRLLAYLVASQLHFIVCFVVALILLKGIVESGSSDYVDHSLCLVAATVSMLIFHLIHNLC
ncbi:hypothetical protein P168DRAFT_292949 [Aspergillus campestris IBT 28561]|uniref:Uncharacterized protein n=1 Tax=Aspergillus campestris (strain IBT 28561) TaxID=1392248 RepID=A0A2I1CTW3_ASPC2|nr:uncharacterized protein P168DRAFT_292949 [Aspergillus campestris IBT 28561]PKY01055.1 hypothetical protein P168DRAFT_292949 [Aspergillus campestris IBT 28561]